MLDFLDLWAVVKLLSSDRNLAFTSMSGSDWHTSKQKCIIGQVIRVTCDRTTTDLRARDPRTPSVSLSALTRAPEAQPLPDRRDTLATNLRLTGDALRPISGRPTCTTWARRPRVTCVTRQKFARAKNFKSDLRPTYDRAEWQTRPSSELRPICKNMRPKQDPATS